MPVKFHMQPSFPASSFPSTDLVIGAMALILLDTSHVGAMAWPSAGDAPLTCDPPQHPFTASENWYQRNTNLCL